jgi:hypothetical protein
MWPGRVPAALQCGWTGGKIRQHLYRSAEGDQGEDSKAQEEAVDAEEHLRRVHDILKAWRISCILNFE